jgi:hypothetical protein
MPTPRVHIIATESRTLCGISVVGNRTWVSSWADWMRDYIATPERCCPKCRRVCLRYSDRVRQIRTADQVRRDHLDNLDLGPNGQ